MLTKIKKYFESRQEENKNKDGMQVRTTPPPGAKVVELGKQEKKCGCSGCVTNGDGKHVA
jgi:hypothetical protein